MRAVIDTQQSPHSSPRRGSGERSCSTPDNRKLKALENSRNMGVNVEVRTAYFASVTLQGSRSDGASEKASVDVTLLILTATTVHCAELAKFPGALPGSSGPDTAQKKVVLNFHWAESIIRGGIRFPQAHRGFAGKTTSWVGVFTENDPVADCAITTWVCVSPKRLGDASTFANLPTIANPRVTNEHILIARL